MKYNLLSVILLALGVSAVPVLSAQSIKAGQGKPAANADAHAHAAGETHDDHQPAAKKSSDGHDHSSEKAGDAYGDEEGENRTEISPESARRMGVVVEKAKDALVEHTVPLTGRITLNQNTRAKVPARFPGIVRSVEANLGQHVEKGQVLATVEANDSMRSYDVVAPISGFVLERNTNIGDVANGDPLFVIADLSDVWAKFHVFPRDADWVRRGQSVKVNTFDGGESATGKIDMFFPMADDISQTQIAIIVLPNPKEAWKPGMTVMGDVTVELDSVKVGVRESALQKMEELGDVVFVREGNFYEARPVKIGKRGGGYVEITEGLEEGEDYVAEGSFIIKSDILKATAEHAH